MVKSKTLTIISPYLLNKQETESIIAQIAVNKSQEFVLDNVVDKSLLAGFIVKGDDYYLDLSLKTKLKQIVDSLN